MPGRKGSISAPLGTVSQHSSLTHPVSRKSTFCQRKEKKRRGRKREKKTGDAVSEEEDCDERERN
jgi:hypothetical protein